MPVSVDELAKCAADYSTNASTESQNRTCVSRAYYAAYHASSEFHHGLPSKGHLPSDARFGLHEKLIRQLTNPSVAKGASTFNRSKSIGYMLVNLRKARVRADYDLASAVSIDEAKQVIADVEVLIEKSRLRP